MSINPLSTVTNIWSRATTALASPQDTGTLPPSTSNSASAPSQAGRTQTIAASTPFQQLSSDLQQVLLQLQSNQNGSGGGAQSASLGQSPTGSSQQVQPHHHHHHRQAPAADQSSGPTIASGSAGSTSLLSAVA